MPTGSSARLAVLEVRGDEALPPLQRHGDPNVGRMLLPQMRTTVPTDRTRGGSAIAGGGGSGARIAIEARRRWVASP